MSKRSHPLTGLEQLYILSKKRYSRACPAARDHVQQYKTPQEAWDAISVQWGFMTWLLGFMRIPINSRLHKGVARLVLLVVEDLLRVSTLDRRPLEKFSKDVKAWLLKPSAAARAHLEQRYVTQNDRLPFGIKATLRYCATLICTRDTYFLGHGMNHGDTETRQSDLIRKVFPKVPTVTTKGEVIVTCELGEFERKMSSATSTSAGRTRRSSWSRLTPKRRKNPRKS